MPLPPPPGFEEIYTSSDSETEQDRYIIMPSATLPRPIGVKIELKEVISSEEESDVLESDSDESLTKTESESDGKDPKICEIAGKAKKHNGRVGNKGAKDGKSSEATQEVEGEAETMTDINISRSKAQLSEMGKGVEVEEEWHELKMAELKVFQKKTYLMSTQSSLIYEALANKMVQKDLISSEEESDVLESDSDKSVPETGSESNGDDSKICKIADKAKKHNIRVVNKRAKDEKDLEETPEVEVKVKTTKDFSITKTRSQLSEMGKGVELEEEWRELMMAELKVFHKKMYLMSTQLSLVIEALSNK